MPLIAESNQKIVKNTLALYFRQIITMAVALFTSRIVLQELGVTDYGVNNIVGGVVGMFGFLSGTLTRITQRFISVEMGKGGNPDILQKIFSTSMILHIAAGVIIIILAETAGLWFLNNKLVIPAERMIAANWVYQFAVFSFVISLLNAPLTALIISHEDMHVYGYMGLFDVVMQLTVAYSLTIVKSDKLVFLASFGFAIMCAVWLIYFIYCRKKYQEAKFKFAYDGSLAKELRGFGGYVLVTNIFWILRTHGINILLNIFFGPAINAARGLANSVNFALQSFCNNFRQAIVPQITKSCAANDTGVMWNLVERGNRMSYFLLFIFSIPVLLETEFILKLWLGNVPEYTTIFVKLIIIEALLSGRMHGIADVVYATGKLKTWQSVSYAINTLLLVLSYLTCKAGYPPQYVMAVYPFAGILFLPLWIMLAKKLFNFPVKRFIKESTVPVILVFAVSFLPFYYTEKLTPASPLYSCAIILASMLWTGIAILLIGLKKEERIAIITFAKRKIGWEIKNT